ncbi:MAG TPA: cytochrome c oxidase assembly protein, partial [Dehalococcoidia bacterium]|nr:cytochrome c oxidase assembly protein [Dehalococcoidia bacterium]
IIVLLFALVSPIDTYGDDLFISHMLQHVLVMMVVAPLLILGKPVTLGLRAASPAIRRRYLLPTLRSRALNLLLRPQIVLALFVSTIWLWHIPDLYDAAIANDALHSLEHFSFLAASLLFWWLIIDADPTPLRPGHPVRAVMLIVAIIQGIVLGSVITSLGEPIYETYEAAAVARDWGPSALSDQRTGAGLVWIPSGLVFVLALLITFQAWLDRMERETEQEDMVRRLRSERASYFEGEALAPPRRPN